MVSGIFTTLLLVIFLGIVVWAFSSKRRKDFDEAAQLPLREDEPIQSEKNNDKGERS
ncbi:CcoQ/FixQ family Cbb3-type cytochrome c oxidase assembly chaperone [Spiribacter sp. C176]|uniref:CcoQ/FixQ family Cbb3-type cytochrome c oxidase assembly chaperone n=1 Tax=Spiribacter salilacus TaxID=2664894 RepID=A0A6N7QSH5_9GAMM|nr:cbb3-type cytochrome c oxidase subunit 3 [Spiribacter salilacus]MRH78942.1 CcoQ/FixQ family Cbb3-type cytochrome c oxidase assembly chaperone [Spiribacter salilacus]